MLIKTWIAVMIIVFIFVIAFISLFAWITADERLGKERALNKELSDENLRLSVENAQMKAKISFLRLHIESEKK